MREYFGDYCITAQSYPVWMYLKDRPSCNETEKISLLWAKYIGWEA